MENALYRKGRHVGYVTNWRFILCKCGRWFKCPSINIIEVNRMIEIGLRDGQLPVPVVPIFLAYNRSTDSYFCYDGNEQIEACRYIDNIVRFYCKDIGNAKAIVDIISDVNDDDVYFECYHNTERRDILHMTTCLAPIAHSVEEEIKGLAVKYVTRYPKFASTAMSPRSPNFKIEKFIEDVRNIYKRLNAIVSISDIDILLERLNEIYANDHSVWENSKIKPEAKFKCHQHGFWLYINGDLNVDHIVELYSRFI